MKHKIIVVTPAGRKRYLEILAKYILSDKTINEWHLWDNCRYQEDRDYINNLPPKYNKIKVIRIQNADGTNKSVNKFYGYTKNKSNFYIKMDDDIVFLPKNFGEKIYNIAKKEKGKYLWWSPMIVNNAICSYLFRHKNIIFTKANLSAQANCPIGWRSGIFAENLHKLFINSLKQNNLKQWEINENFELKFLRFSINCIAYFGETVMNLGEKFCPLGVDDEEQISGTLPIITNRPGRLIGNIIVSHFSFYTQEDYLLGKNRSLLYEYARIAGINNYAYIYKRKRVSFIFYIKNIFRVLLKYIINDVFKIYGNKIKEFQKVTLLCRK